MGIINHNAIIVTGMIDHVKRARELAIKIFENVYVDGDGEMNFSGLVSPVVGEGWSVNFYSSFLIAPDGSKEGWSTSAALDEARDAFIDALEKARSAPGTDCICVRWLEVSYGEMEDEGPRVVRSNDTEDLG